MSFYYRGQLVGAFETLCPGSEGVYSYVALRGMGHLRLQQQLEAAGSAECHYVQSENRVSFRVRRVEPGKLALSDFKVQDASSPLPPRPGLTRKQL